MFAISQVSSNFVFFTVQANSIVRTHAWSSCLNLLKSLQHVLAHMLVSNEQYLYLLTTPVNMLTTIVSNPQLCSYSVLGVLSVLLLGQL